MKRFIAWILVLLMVFAVATASAADKKKKDPGYVDLKLRGVVINRHTAYIGYQDWDTSLYGIMTNKGKVVLEPTYYRMSAVYDYPLFTVEAYVDDPHRRGVIDKKGEVIVPPEYIEVKVLSDRWMVGFKAEECKAEDKEYTYTSGTDTFYRVSSVDVYYKGKKVGDFSRAEYDSASAWGDYIRVNARDKTQAVYNKKLKKSSFKGDYINEYDSNYYKGKYTYTHTGTNKPAFTEGCTLKKENVYRYIQYTNGEAIGLDGTVLFKSDFDYLNDFRGGYAVGSQNSKRGLINEAGEVIIPPEYDQLGNSEAQPFEYGCISAVKDGKFGFVNDRNQVTCAFIYGNDSVQNYTTFAKVKNPDGTVTVMSGLIGVLPDQYKSATFQSGARCFVAEDMDGKAALIDILGNVMIPWTETYNISYNRLGTVAAYQLEYGTYRIYHFDAFDPKTIPEPTEQTVPACPNCGYEFPDGHVTNYCPDCGTKQKK